MRPRPGTSRLFWQIAMPTAVLLLVGVVAVAWQASRLMREAHTAQVAVQLDSSAALVEGTLGDELENGRRESIDAVAKRIGREAGLRVTVIAADGVVLGESDGDPSVMDNHATRPEVVEAIASGRGTAARRSDTISTEMMYSARAVRRDGRLIGVVRTGVPLSALQAADRDLRSRSLATALVTALLTIACGVWVARRVTRPLEELEAAAQAHTRRDGSVAPPIRSSVSEVQRVAAAMEQMASDLDSRIATLVAERNEQEAVLSSMVEGVLAIDASERVMTINSAAARWLGVGTSDATGRTIHEVTRNAALQRFAAEALASETALERDVALHGEEARFLQAHGAPVRDAAGRRIGAVIVLNDVTRLRRLETVRRDFVANVSHELKTPVTSIKGFLETLLGGAIDDPANARRFVEIAARQADRLGAIIEDLLMLSRLDQDGDQHLIEKSPTSVATIVQGAVEVCRLKADRKRVPLEVHCEPELRARLNGAMVEQALVNLIDNAIKYSEEGRPVKIEATRDGDSIVLAVEDRGPGIEAEHLPRLFERFYRIDKARTRAVGGTGLGLAIVKHIAQSQGGSVEVESRPGRGSTFTLRFPAT